MTQGTGAGRATGRSRPAAGDPRPPSRTHHRGPPGLLGCPSCDRSGRGCSLRRSRARAHRLDGHRLGARRVRSRLDGAHHVRSRADHAEHVGACPGVAGAARGRPPAGPSGPRDPRAGRPERRQRWLIVVAGVITAVFIAQLVNVQVLRGPALAAEAQNDRTRSSTTIAHRGDITDADGVVLATSVDRYTVAADLQAIARFEPRAGDLVNGEPLEEGGAVGVAKLLARSSTGPRSSSRPTSSARRGTSSSKRTSRPRCSARSPTCGCPRSSARR